MKSTQGKTIGEIFCEDGSVYEIKGVIDGVVIELNDNLFRNPEWVTDYVKKDQNLCLSLNHSSNFIISIRPIAKDSSGSSTSARRQNYQIKMSLTQRNTSRC